MPALWKPQAVARYLVDLPEGASLGEWYQRLQDTGPVHWAQVNSFQEIRNHVQARAARLRATPHRLGGHLLDQVRELIPGRALALTFWKSEIFSKAGNLACETYLVQDRHLFQSDFRIPGEGHGVDAFLRGYARTLERLKPRDPAGIPTEGGSCFDHGILLDAPGQGRADLVMAAASWPDPPRLRFAIAVLRNGDRLDPPLLSRPGEVLDRRDRHLLRAGRRRIGEFEGQELLRSIPGPGRAAPWLFIWETPGRPNRWDWPQIRLELRTFPGTETTLPRASALATWDRFITSLRWRPTTPPTGPEP